MKLTKFGHSCVLVEAEHDGETRIALFDPGEWSHVPVESIEWIDDIFISHGHADHCDIETLKRLLAKFPDVRVSGPSTVVQMLHAQGIMHASDVMPSGARAFMAPHEAVEPFGRATPEELGVHFMSVYSHPGDSHSFRETMPVLALPVVAPWGSTRRAAELALELKPRYVLPVHDWFFSDEARAWTYDALESVLAGQGITLLRPEAGVSLEVPRA
jgi:L-ascorbate metabolism protein UlaG (beta-lactamase superfamily)